MAPRASWTGYLTLSAVSCPVALYTAQTTAEKISFTTLNARTGHRVRQQMVDAETGEEVAREATVKGARIDREHHVPIEAEALEEIRPENTHTLCIERFVPRGSVDAVHTDGSHFLAPKDDQAAQTFAVLRDAMAEKAVVGIGRVVLSSRERLVMVAPRGRGMLMTTLHWPHEVRSDAELFGDIPDIEVDEEMLDLATHVIGRKRGHFDHAACEDAYEQALAELIRARQEGRAADLPTERPSARIIDIKDALRRSLEAEGGRPAKAASGMKAKSGAGERRTSAPSRSRTGAKSEGEAAEKPARRRAKG